MIKIIAAMSKNRCIGNKGKLPWYLPPDLNFFKKMTEGQIVIMGRRTWDSLPIRPLLNRTNIIISRDLIIPEAHAQIYRDTWYAFTALKNRALETKQDIYVIGGSTIYRQALAHGIVDEILLTEINQEFDGDTFFPELSDHWKPSKILEGNYKDISFITNRWLYE